MIPTQPSSRPFETTRATRLRHLSLVLMALQRVPACVSQEVDITYNHNISPLISHAQVLKGLLRRVELCPDRPTLHETL